MRLEIEHNGALLTITEPRAGGEYPLLAKVGTLLLAARAGHLDGVGAGETPKVTVDLDDDDRRASRLLGRPLRDVAEVFDDAGDSLLRGLISAVSYGRTLSLTIEA